ncbi:MAG: hypothetical protein HN929_11490 [Chloroflexi bacterium]|jgi:hypothetical protein|nr:hypothetical protein [Chloroflexota bacterium]
MAIPGTYDLKEITMKFAKKQPNMADEITENAPIVERLRWKPSTHDFWNMAEHLTDIDGATFVKANAPLPFMNVSSELEKIDMAIMGGVMEVGEDTSKQFGSAENYFAGKIPSLLKKAGMDTEKEFYYNNWMAKAIDDGNVFKAGATSGLCYSMIVIRFDPDVNIGLFNPKGFKQGSLLNKDAINGGSRYHLRSKAGVLGFGMTLKGYFGWQNISKRTVATIVNIQEGSLPTSLQIDDAIAKVRGTDRDTMILCHPRCKNLALAPFKENKLQMGITDKTYNRRIDEWDGIPVITSYNIAEGTEPVVS